MGKSIRSKRKKRLRTIKREIVEPYYDAMDRAKMAAQEAAMAAPKVEIPQRRQDLEDVPVRGRTEAPTGVAMAIDCEDSKSATPRKLKPKRTIGKRGRSKTPRELASRRKKNLKF